MKRKHEFYFGIILIHIGCFGVVIMFKNILILLLSQVFAFLINILTGGYKFVPSMENDQ